jgi:hypothetical protein
MNDLIRPFTFRNKCFIPQFPENAVDMPAFRPLYQESKVEPFFFPLGTMIAVGEVHPSDNGEFAIYEQDFVMQSEAEMKALRDENWGKKPEKYPGIIDFF